MATLTADQSVPAGRPPDRLERLVDIVKTFVAVVALLMIAASLSLLGKMVIDPNGSEEFTVGRRPSQYYELFDNEQRVFLDSTYDEVLGVAHNSGASIEATLEAIIFGADAIEVDVVSVGNQLYAGHSPPLPYIGDRFFRGSPLERVWTASYRASTMKLDLKETSPEYVSLVADFLVSRPIDRDIIVASRSPSVLTALRELAPDTILLLSVPDEATLSELRTNVALIEVIDGVTARESVLTAEHALWLQDRGLGVYAWTVNDIERVNELVALGVDGITTDNLALVALLAEE